MAAPSADDEHRLDDPAPPPTQPKPPLLEYPSKPIDPEPDSERWSEVARALVMVLGVLFSFFFIFFGVCGIVVRGCG